MSAKRLSVAFLVLAFMPAAPALAAPDPRPTSGTKEASPEERFWMIGASLSEAVVLVASEAKPGEVKAKLERTHELCREIGIEPPPAPQLTDDRPADVRAWIAYGTKGLRAVLLGVLHSEEQARRMALFDVAFKGGILSAFYSPNNEEARATARFIENNAPVAGISTEAWEPLVTAVRAREPQVESSRACDSSSWTGAGESRANLTQRKEQCRGERVRTWWGLGNCDGDRCRARNDRTELCEGLGNGHGARSRPTRRAPSPRGQSCESEHVVRSHVAAGPYQARVGEASRSRCRRCLHARDDRKRRRAG